MISPLGRFLEAALLARGESPEQFGSRTGLNASGLYQIMRGERKYVTDRTLDRIAEGLGLTPAEMQTMMGKGADLAPDEVELLAIFRQVPGEHRPAAKNMLRGLAVPPSRRATKRRTDPTAKRLDAARERNEQRPIYPDDDSALTPHSHDLLSALRIDRLARLRPFAAPTAV